MGTVTLMDSVMPGTAVLLCLTATVTAQILSDSCYCGQKEDTILKVINGQTADRHEFPWAAHLSIKTSNGRHMCGGSLINDRFIVTAAHCVSQKAISFIEATLGEHDITIREGFEFTSRVRHFGYTIHNSYSEQSRLGVIEYDIAVLELEKPVDFSIYRHIRPICLPSSTYVDYTGLNLSGIVKGWGTTLVQFKKGSGLTIGKANRNSAADILQKLTDVRILGHGECDSIFEDYEKRTRGKAKLRPSNVCGNSPTGDSCIGDSGSGLVTWNNDIQAYELIGVVSFGVGCNSSFFGTKLPGVYTRVSTTVDWIRGKSNRGTYCSLPSRGTTFTSTIIQPPPPSSSGWSQWSKFTPCVGSGIIGTKERNRRCRGESCIRLMQTQQRPCYI